MGLFGNTEAAVPQTTTEDTSMTTQDTTSTPDPNVADAEEFEKASLDAPEGHFRFTLRGVYGPEETKNGKVYLSGLYALDQQAEYDANGNLTNVVDLKRPHRIFIKFWIGSKGGNAKLIDWLTNTTGVPKGETDPATGRRIFNKDEALQRSIDRSAWNEIIHKHDPEYGWQVETGWNFRRKAPNRIKVRDDGAA